MKNRIFFFDYYKWICTGHVFILLMSCSKLGCPLSAGPTSSEFRDLPEFKEIVIYDKINLILTQDSVQKVKVQAGEHMIKGIETDITDSVLTIRNRNSCSLLTNPDYQISVYISSSQLQKISYYGAGNISSTNTINAPQFTMDSWYGAGSIHLKLMSQRVNVLIRNEDADITLEGNTGNTNVYCAETGTMNLLNLSSAYVSIVQKSVKDIYVNATGILQVSILYVGNVYYKGNPSIIDSLITSSGKLIHLQ